MFNKRAPVKSVCGRVTNGIGERLDGVEFTLTDEKGAVLFATRSDTRGFFVFRSVLKGDYMLNAKAPGYHVTQREIRVMKTDEKKCSPKIEVSLGFDVCGSGTRVKGVDKLSDLEGQSP